MGKIAVAAVPDEMLLAANLIGTEDMVRARLRAYRDAGKGLLASFFATRRCRDQENECQERTPVHPSSDGFESSRIQHPFDTNSDAEVGHDVSKPLPFLQNPPFDDEVGEYLIRGHGRM